MICRREWWRDVPAVHYYSDNAFDDLMRATGHPPTVVDGFDFLHLRAMAGRDESSERLLRDREAYEEWRVRSSDLHQLQGQG